MVSVHSKLDVYFRGLQGRTKERLLDRLSVVYIISRDEEF